MNKYLSCNIIKDLFPVYFDGIASQQTNTYLKKHLNECEFCRNEYKKFCELTEKKETVVMSEANSIIKLRKKIITSFISITIISIILITLSMFCSYSEALFINSTIFDFLALIIIYIGMYFLPLLGILVSIIWKSILDKDRKFFPNITISILVVLLLFEIIFLLWHFIEVITF